MGRRRRKTLVAKVGPGTGGGSQTLVVGGPDDAGDGGLDARGGPANYQTFGGKGATVAVANSRGPRGARTSARASPGRAAPRSAPAASRRLRPSRPLRRRAFVIRNAAQECCWRHKGRTVAADVHALHLHQLPLERVHRAQELLVLRVVVIWPHPAVRIADDEGLADLVGAVDAGAVEAA